MFSFNNLKFQIVFLPISWISYTEVYFFKCFCFTFIEHNWCNVWFPQLVSNQVINKFSIYVAWHDVDSWSVVRLEFHKVFFMFFTAVNLLEATSFLCCIDKTNSSDDESSESNVSVYTSCTCFFFLFIFAVLHVLGKWFDFPQFLQIAPNAGFSILTVGACFHSTYIFKFWFTSIRSLNSVSFVLLGLRSSLKWLTFHILHFLHLFQLWCSFLISSANIYAFLKIYFFFLQNFLTYTIVTNT